MSKERGRVSYILTVNMAFLLRWVKVSICVFLS